MGRRQVADRRRTPPRLRAARPPGAPFQAAKHVEQRGCGARRRDRPGSGPAGAFLRSPSERAIEEEGFLGRGIVDAAHVLDNTQGEGGAPEKLFQSMG
jgi:hypothetical protein